MNNIGERIKLLRLQRKITQEKLAKAIELHKSNISGLENGSYKPSAIAIIKLSQYFNVSTDWLLTGKEYKNDLSDIEKDILNCFRTLDDNQKKSIYEIIKSINPYK